MWVGTTYWKQALHQLPFLCLLWGGGGENTYDIVLDVEKTKDTEKSPEDCLSSKMLGLKISELGTLGVKPKLSMIKSSAQSPVNVLPCTLSKLDMDSLNKNNDN